MENQNQNDLISENQDTQIPISPEIKREEPWLSTGTPIPTEGSGVPENYFNTQESQPFKATVETPPPASPYTPMPSQKVPDDLDFFEEKKDSNKTSASALTKERNPFDFLKNKKVVIGAAAVAGGIIIGVAAYLLYPILSPQKTISIVSNQSNIDLVVDGTEIKNISTPYSLKIKKGGHEIAAKKEGFSSITKTITITSSKKQDSISFELVELIGVNKIIDGEAFFPIFNAQLQTLMFLQKSESGYDIKEYNLGDKSETVLMDKINNIEKVAWSPTFRQLAIKSKNVAENTSENLNFIPEYGEGSFVNWVVDLERKDLVNIKTTPLNPAIKNIDFKPEGDKITYFFQNDAIRNISVANPDGKGYEPLLNVVSIKFEPDVRWSPDGKRIAIFASSNASEASKGDNIDVYMYNFETKNSAKITNDGVSFGSIFSPDGANAIYQSGTKIFISDIAKKENEQEGDKDSNLGLELEVPLDNCAWIDNKSIIVFDNKTKDVVIAKVNGEKTTIGYKKEGILSAIKKVIYLKGSLYLFSTNSVYEMKIGEMIE